MSDLNDPRVFFAAERTLLAWNRTSPFPDGFRLRDRALRPVCFHPDATTQYAVATRHIILDRPGFRAAGGIRCACFPPCNTRK